MSEERLPLHLKLIYGLGDHSTNVALVALTMIFPFYLTDVVGMRIGLAGLVPLVGRSADAISDVWMGRLSDRTTWKAGRRRPFILIGMVPFAAAFTAIWFPAHFESAGLQFAYYAGIYILISVSMTIVVVPYQALLPELTENYHERTSLATFRSFSSLVGTLLILLTFRPLAMRLGGDDGAWAMTGAVFGLWILIPWLPIWWVTYERREEPSGKPLSTENYFRLLASNGSFRRLLGLFALGRVAIDLPMALFLHYFTYVIGRPEDFEIVMGVFLLSTMIAMPFWLRFARGRDKATVYRYGCVGWVFGLGCLFINQPEWPFSVTLVATAFAGAGYAVCDMIPWSMVADVADEDEILSGQRREGLYVGVFTFLRKFSGALSVAVAFAVLDWVGFEQGVENDPPVVWALRALTALVPVVFVMVSSMVARGYTLGAIRHREILDELEAMKRAR